MVSTILEVSVGISRIPVVLLDYAGIGRILKVFAELYTDVFACLSRCL